MSDIKPLDVYVLFAADADKPYIKVADDGCLAIFDDEASAKAAKRRHSDTDYKQVNYYSQKQVDQMQAENEALRARLADLTGCACDEEGPCKYHAMVSTSGRAYVLRQQAEAVAEFIAQYPRMTEDEIRAYGDITVARETLERDAQRLRAEADGIERGGSDD